MHTVPSSIFIKIVEKEVFLNSGIEFFIDIIISKEGKKGRGKTNMEQAGQIAEIRW